MAQPAIAVPLACRTCRVAQLVRLLGHTAGGCRSEKLMARQSLPICDSTILRQFKRLAFARAPVAVLGIDNWSWRKGVSYGSVLIGLERRQVVDVLHSFLTMPLQTSLSSVTGI